MKALPFSRSVSVRWMRWPKATLSAYLILVIVVATVPLGALTSWLIAQQISASREQLTTDLQRSVGALTLMIEREQASSVDSLAILSNAAALQTQDLPAFHRLLSRFPTVRPTWRRVVLMDLDGRVLLRSDDAYEPGGSAMKLSLDGSDILSGVPAHITNLMPGTTPGESVSRIDVPVVIRGQVRYVLGAEVDSQGWRKLLADVAAPESGFLTVFDGSDRVVYRSMNSERYVGQTLLPVTRDRMAGRLSGFFKTQTFEGQESYVAWQRVSMSGWGIGVGVMATPLDQGNRVAIASVVGAGLGSLLIGIVLSFIVARRVKGPLEALASGGAAALQGDVAVREIGLLRDAMGAAEREREAARLKLEAKANEFETLFNTSPIGLSITLDPDCREVWRNPAKMEMFHLQSDRAPTFALIENGEHLPPERHPLQRAARGETLWNQELEVRHDDGRVLKLLAHAVPLRDFAGHPRGAIATFVDITERVKASERLMLAQSRLQESQHLVELAQEAGEVGFFDHVFEADQVSMTSGLTRLLGLERKAVVTTWEGWLAHVNQEDAKAIKAALQLAWRDRQEHLVFRFRTAPPLADDGTAPQPRWLSSRMVTMYDEQSRPTRMVGVMVDVTAQQLVEQERARLIAQEQKARHDAEKANRAKDEFLAMLGHELRNPLSAISAAIEVLNRIDPQGDQAVRVRMIITRQTRHLARLMDDLLDVARVIAGKIHLSLQPVNLGATVGRLVNTMKMAGLVQPHPIEVDVQDVWIQADAMRLEQIVNNLVTNAAKYSPPDKPIKVLVGREGERAMLRVIDEGPGIPPHLLPHIFDLFVQGERSPDRREGGLGIGLTLVKSLVELHEGHIDVSTSEAGSAFTVDLPVSEPAHLASHNTPTLAPAQRDVVVVEDNDDAREALRFMLELKGHKVWAEPDGVAGLERIMAVRPHLALVDIGLPGLPGFEVARQAREGGHEGWMIALSGYGQQQDVQRALACGFDAHMVKPLDEQVLENYLGRAPREEGAYSAG